MADKYANDGTGVLSLRLVRAPDEVAALRGDEQHLVSSFHPKFVYPIFGEEEQIYGYEDLSIQLSFASGSLAMCLEIDHASTIPKSSGVAPDPIESEIYKVIPPDYTKSSTVFDETVAKDSGTFKPLGEKIGSYSRKPKVAKNSKGKGKKSVDDEGDDGKDWMECQEGEDEAVTYEMYRCTWDTPGFREYHRRMQIFILLYIEGGSYIVEDEERWEFVVLFEKRQRDDSATYHFCGYVTFYPFFHYPARIRLRLSQFIILPPYQSAGHAKLYASIYNYLLTRDDVAELTVEDPSEAFEDLRDKNDLKLVIARGIFDGVEAPVDRKWYDETKAKWKIADRQFSRLPEMALKLNLMTLPEPDDEKETAYRLSVKARLYRFNFETLQQMEAEERKDRLQDTFERVMDDYDRIFRGERRESG